VRPDFEIEWFVLANQLEVGPVRGDEPGPTTSGGEGNEDVKVEIAQFGRLESSFWP